MKTWKLALVGLATLSTSAFAAPVTTGSAVAAAKTATVVSVPDLGGDEIVIVENKVTGEISVQAADGTLVPTQAVAASDIQKACYGGPCGLAYGNGYLGYGYPVAPPTVIQEEEVVKIRRFRRSTVVPGYDVGPGYGYGGPGYGGPGYGGPVGPGYAPGYDGY